MLLTISYIFEKLRGNFMKKNRRTITVDGKKYVWWYKIRASLCIITVSPFEDKTARVCIAFNDTECDGDYGYGITFPLYVELEKDGEQHRLKLIDPKMAALLTMYLFQKELFKPRKEITLHGYELLMNMGYNIIRIENEVDF